MTLQRLAPTQLLKDMTRTLVVQSAELFRMTDPLTSHFSNYIT